MIRLREEYNEKDKLLKLIKLAIDEPDSELECIIGNNSIHSLNNREDFVNILKRIKNKKPYLKESITDRLDISIPRDSKYSKYVSRISINGVGAINSYCNNEKISNILGSVSFELKELMKVGVGKDDIARVKLPSYGVRFNLKKEKTLDKDSSIIRNLISDWKDIPKFYRRKKVFSFYHTDGDFRIDLSIINKTRDIDYTKDNDKYKYYKNIRESRVLESRDYSYEIEVEWLANRNTKLLVDNNINTAKERLDFFKKILIKFLQQIGIILQAIDGSLFIITKEERNDIIDKISKLPCFKRCIYPNVFPLAVDLEYKHISKLSLEQYATNTDTNIRMDYLVTEKADGDRNILYISNNGRCYLFNRSGRLFYTGTVIPEYANSVFDGEYITSDINGSFIQNIYLFDAYMVKGKNIVSLPFGTVKNKNGRHIHIKEIAKYYHNTSSNILVENERYSLKIFSKTYYAGDTISKKVKNDTEIFNACNKILQKVNVKYGGLLDTGHQFSYPIDGLIFQPLNYGVRQNQIDDDYEPKLGGRWYSNLKWKPSHHITIDFKVKIIKEISSNKELIIYNDNNKYNKVNLTAQLFGTDEENQLLAFKILNEGDNFRLYPENYPFIPLNPYHGHLNINGTLNNDSTSMSNFILDRDNNLKTEEKDVIEDEMIVECRFDNSAEEGYQWIPVRVRSDKTKANALMTALKAWELIVNPITTNIISGIEEYVDKSFQYKEGRKYISKSMNSFHNYVKGELIKRALTNKVRPKVLDLACGKMGDMHKYSNNNVDTLVGIDIMPDHLFNPKDGAAVRLLGLGNNRMQNRSANLIRMVKKTTLILADYTKNLSSGEACIDDLGKYYTNILYGRHHPEGKGKLQSMYNVGVNQFHLVVCNFAISYAFNNRDDLHQLLLNVQENLKDQGYFVITYLDGREVLKKLNSSSSDGRVSGNIDDHLVWSIELVDKSNNVDLDIEPYGNKILSYLETFTQPAEENLVDPILLQNEALQYDLKLVDSKLFDEEPDSMYNQFQTVKPDMWEILDTQPVLKEWSSTHRWAIFQKVDGLNDNL